jgi:hypothetical protein
MTPEKVKPRLMAEYEIWIMGRKDLLMDPMNKKTRENLRKKINDPPPNTAEPKDICAGKLYGREDGDKNAQVILPTRCPYSCWVEAGRKISNSRVRGKSTNISTATSTTLPGIMEFLEDKWEFIDPYTGQVIHEPEWFVDECRGVGQSKVAVCITRPRIPRWCLRGRIGIFLEEVMPQDIFRLAVYAARKVGYCSYRPQKKGPFGIGEVVKMMWVGGDAPDVVSANKEANPKSVPRSVEGETYDNADLEDEEKEEQDNDEDEA